ncbi:unnamed protein product [Ostreobium quekettii]|uniref:Uncharacterized protein n=1 Tax=Ostreobium quekettii TaxID=121088 RepID=A0A8S1INX1_9CHLO|nr:unnamed protein product [Ostreobium quekettii]
MDADNLLAVGMEAVRSGDAGKVEETLREFHALVKNERREKVKRTKGVSKFYRMSSILLNDLKVTFHERTPSTSVLVPKYDKICAQRFSGLACNGTDCELFGFLFSKNDSRDTRFLFFPPECLVCVGDIWQPDSVPQWLENIGRFVRRHVDESNKVLCKGELLQMLKDAVKKDNGPKRIFNNRAHFLIDAVGVQEVASRIVRQQLGCDFEVDNLKWLESLGKQGGPVAIPRDSWELAFFEELNAM